VGAVGAVPGVNSGVLLINLQRMRDHDLARSLLLRANHVLYPAWADPFKVRARWVTLRARGVTLRARWVTLRASLGDAKSSLGDAESSLGDAESSRGDAKSSLGDV
jgi:hypothetical protein